jgi:shikimate kinase
VGLTADQEVIFERVSRNTKRPLLKTPNPRQTIQEMLAARGALYEAAAQFTVDTSLLTHDEVAECILTQASQVFSWPNTP